MTEEQPSHSLSVFDDLNRDNPKERRLAVFALNDYYGAILAKIGDESLDFRSSDLDQGIRHQWDKAKSRFDELDDIDIPDDYDESIYSINNIRGNIAHDFTKNPPRDILEKSRDTAPEWSIWFSDMAERFEDHQETLTPTEALVQLGKRTIDHIEDSPVDYRDEFSYHQKSLNKDVEELEGRLDSHSDAEGPTRDLVGVISEIMDLEREKEKLEKDRNQREQRRLEEQKKLDRAENTYNCIVVDKEEDTGRIDVVTNEPAKPDEHYSFFIQEPNISDSEREKLRNLETNESVKLWVGINRTLDSRGRVQSIPYIKEVM